MSFRESHCSVECREWHFFKERLRHPVEQCIIPPRDMRVLTSDASEQGQICIDVPDLTYCYCRGSVRQGSGCERAVENETKINNNKIDECTHCINDTF